MRSDGDMKIEYRDDLPLASEYAELFETTGWNTAYQASAEELSKALRQSWYTVSAYEGDGLVGFGRVVFAEKNRVVLAHTNAGESVRRSLRVWFKSARRPASAIFSSSRRQANPVFMQNGVLKNVRPMHPVCSCPGVTDRLSIDG